MGSVGYIDNTESTYFSSKIFIYWHKNNILQYKHHKISYFNYILKKNKNKNKFKKKKKKKNHKLKVLLFYYIIISSIKKHFTNVY